MNSPFPSPATTSLRGDNAGASVPLGAPATYSWRYDLCPSCDTATGSRGCPECEGDGEITAACVGCFNVYPLNDDGECADCASLVEVEPKQLGDGWHRVAA